MSLTTFLVTFRSAAKKTMLSMVASLIIFGCTWYAISFAPYIPELKSLASNGGSKIKNREELFYKISISGETKKGIRSYAMRQAYYFLALEGKKNRMLFWHANNLLWYVASYVHFSENEVFGIWIECSIFKCGEGLAKAAQHYFHKTLADLSEKEIASLVASVRNPTIYAPGTKAGEKRTNQILEGTIGP